MAYLGHRLRRGVNHVWNTWEKPPENLWKARKTWENLRKTKRTGRKAEICIWDISWTALKLTENWRVFGKKKNGFGHLYFVTIDY